jgi:microcystin-dependent protein
MISFLRRSVVFAALVLMPGSALAMSASSIPTKIPTYFGTSAPTQNITCPLPIPSQINTANGRASWTDGFPPLTFLPQGAGGVPFFGADMNGVLCQLSQWTRWYDAIGGLPYDATFQTAVGGYPNGALVASTVTPGLYWQSTVDNNATNPDTGGAGWVVFDPGTAQSRVITTSGAFAISATDGNIGMARTSSPASSSSTLPTGVPNGKVITVEDLVGNFNVYPVSIAAPGGTTIAGASGVTLASNGESAQFKWYAAASAWSFSASSLPSVPVGSIQIAAGSTADPGYLLAFGECVSQTSYPPLYARLGNTFNSQDGCTAGQFGLPDLRGRTVAGLDNMGGTAAHRITTAGGNFDATVFGATGGVQSSVVAQANLAPFNMNGTFSGNVNNSNGAQAIAPNVNDGSTQGANAGGNVYQAVTFKALTASGSTTVASGGASTPLPTLPPVQVVVYEVKF